MGRASLHLIALCCLLLGVSLPIAAAEFRGVRVLLVAHGDDASPSIGRIVTGAVVVGLAQAGLGVQEIDSDLSDADSAAALLNEREAEFLLLAQHALDGESLEVQLRLIGHDGAVVASATNQGPISLTVDAMIYEAIDALLEAARPALEEAAERNERPSDSATTPVNPPEEGSAQIARSTMGSESPALGASIAAGVSPLFTIGAAEELFSRAMGATVIARLLVSGGGGSVGVAVVAGALSLQAQGAALSARGMIAPLGVTFGFESTPDPLGVFVRFGGGGALLMLENEYVGRLAEVVPFVTGATGAKVRIAEQFGAQLEISFSTYFEGSLLIMGFAPAAYLYYAPRGGG